METTVKGLTPRNVAKYLNIALKQRERALTKFTQDYGPTSATVQELTQELAQMRSAINDLEREPTEIEKAINATKK